MDKAFVLITCEPGKEPSILERLRQMKNVVDVQGTYGVYDIVARIESDEKSQLDNIISDQIRKLDDVNSTLTLIPTALGDVTSNLPEIMPDVIPEQKKPLEEQSSEEENDDFNDEYEEE
ncbi:MAG: Lrp/AsnC ligand binding domain-containing protein [Nitrosopumilaceae archaeon]|nr:Lrp/AsnC ligand binding domain-containing protein [Nitrosopumilaceae archaeon]